MQRAEDTTLEVVTSNDFCSISSSSTVHHTDLATLHQAEKIVGGLDSQCQVNKEVPCHKRNTRFMHILVRTI